MAFADPLALLFSPSGRLDRRTFAYAVIAFYAVGLASQFLFSVGVTGRAGMWAYALAQIALTWVWFVLHAKRMRDAGRGIGGVLTIATLYVLPVVLLVVLIAATAGSSTDQSASSGLGVVFAFLFIYALVVDPSKFGLAIVILIILMLFAYVPLLLALIWSIWAGTRPRASQP